VQKAQVTPEVDISAKQYRLLAEFRYRIREFLHFSEQSSRDQGIEPQQHQLMLAIKGLPSDVRPTISALASRLCIRHHSAVELINRLADRGAVVRRTREEDRREVLVELTPEGEALLQKLSLLHWQQLEASGPELAHALDNVLQRVDEAEVGFRS
jgi:DNA-binding MarR family transcriptional regulator